MEASVQTAPPHSDTHTHHPNVPFAHLALAALGIIYGDIGTSPLYTIKECFSGTHGVATTPANILGILSMVFWSLIFVVSLKYVLFVLRADNKGEGGTFSLLAMLRSRLKNDKRRWAILTILTASGASLLYGDGVITPAISVLSAIEGLNMATDAAANFVVPLTCIILTALIFCATARHGSHRQGFWPGHDYLVRHLGDPGASLHHQATRSPCMPSTRTM